MTEFEDIARQRLTIFEDRRLMPKRNRCLEGVLMMIGLVTAVALAVSAAIAAPYIFTVLMFALER